MKNTAKKSVKSLSPNMVRIEKAIIAKLKVSDRNLQHENVIGLEVTLPNIKGIADISKTARKMRRLGLLKYRVTEGKRYVGLTKKGFSLLNN